MIFFKLTKKIIIYDARLVITLQNRSDVEGEIE